MQPYSFSLLSAISQHEVLANQLIEGGVDSSVFENFVHSLLTHIRTTPRLQGRRVVLLMDNAQIHRHKVVIDTVLRMKAILMFNPQYSPILNPIEHMFQHLKTQLRQQDISTK